MIALLAALSVALFAVSAFAEQPSLAPSQTTVNVLAPKPDPKVIVGDIFATCCMPCHQGETPAAKLDLSKDKFEAALVNVASTEIDTLKLVDTANVRKSYLLMKLRADKRIRANPMPLRAPALESARINAVGVWITKLLNIAATKAASLGVPAVPLGEAAAPAPGAPTTEARKPPDSGGAANR